MDKIIEKKKGLKRKYIIWIVAGLAFVFLLYKALFTEQGSVFRAEKDKLTLSIVETGQFNDYITVIGQVEPISTIFLDAEEGGKVEEKLIEEGEMVKKGDVILKLKNNDLNLNIMNSESNLAYHTNELRNTQIQMEQQKIQNKQQLLQIDYEIVRLARNYEQQKSLFNEGLIAREDFLKVEEDYFHSKKNRDLIYMKLVQDSIFRENQKKQMDQNLENMQLNLLMVQQRREDLNVKAPVDGQLGLLNAEVGESINKGQRIGMIHVLTNFKVNARIDEHYIDRVRRDLTATFERNGINYALNVKKVYPEVREGQFEIDMVFEGEKPENIRTGQTYHVKLELGQSEKAMLLPRGGFFQSTGGQWVFVLNEAETEAVKRSIRIGKQNPQYYEVLEGLQEGEKVITSGYELFGDNDRIKF
ncbi:MAG: efflux transporter periplasmic adaptor subunit [Bacteroidetes bacterium GWF2_42_66]|nr:MAG: efflux transporter periplasmic adaptor subunit [Bacteroidetes bacterium GWA2_42_15]OFY03107.1 MAG: efflux transporter periplasmic adaptor subunit [Bacteroidetes bacterium GWE2_42_39]OFY45215.1 MAG: efflux transporter periplasmic adaptor subunit [Bacteroidetes bacterium GWF2_42_66]HBL74128.1 efflux transporter periplasmic adaptor subunit [Prolixibacteraceae bacterium]HCR90517.1 efflux transporter periplasmic adaptor subunit [Prolixibacteraceae bacterium]